MDETKIKFLMEKVPMGKRWAKDILSRRKTPSKKMAERLEAVTGIARQKWVWPEEFGNPYLPEKPPVAAIERIAEGTP